MKKLATISAIAAGLVGIESVEAIAQRNPYDTIFAWMAYQEAKRKGPEALVDFIRQYPKSSYAAQALSEVKRELSELPEGERETLERELGNLEQVGVGYSG